MGARSGGLGDTFVGWAEGVEGVFWNAGAIAWGRGVSITGGYERPFGMAVLDAHVIGTVASTGRTAVGLGYQEYGFSLYRERTAGLTAGLRLASRLGLGVRIRRMRLSVDGGRNRGWTAFDLGAKIVVRPKVTLGLAAWNAGGASVNVLGQGGMAGVGCQVVPNLALLVDVRKEAGRQTGVSAGHGIQTRPPGHAADGRRGQGRAIVYGRGCDSQGFPDRLCDPVPHRTGSVAQGLSYGGTLNGA